MPMSEHQSNGLLEAGTWTEKDQDATTSASTYVRIKDKLLNISSKSSSDDVISPGAKTGPTAYLDGLRGFAALIVYFHHQELWAHNNGAVLENVFGWDGKYYFATLPGIRLFFGGGHIAVSIFFVISGYALSYKPLMLIQSGELIKLGDNVGSALFRRFIRLYIPVIATTFLYMTIVWHLFGMYTEGEVHEKTYLLEVRKWFIELKNFSYIFTTGGEPWFSYNRHLWSIPVEFKGSIVIYTSLVSFSRCSRNARLLCELGLMYYFMYICDGSWNSMFMAGMFLADIDILSMNNNLPRWMVRLEPYKKVFCYHFLAIGIYLAGVPAYDNNGSSVMSKSQGWHYLSLLRPQAVFDPKWFYLFFAASLIVAAIPRIGFLKHFFENSFNQYLGRISFSLYLVHGPILRSIGDRMYVMVGWPQMGTSKNLPGLVNLIPLSKAGPYGLEISIIIVNIFLLPFTLWIAELCTRAFDRPSLNFAHWLYRKMLPAPPS